MGSKGISFLLVRSLICLTHPYNYGKKKTGFDAPYPKATKRNGVFSQIFKTWTPGTTEMDTRTHTHTHAHTHTHTRKAPRFLRHDSASVYVH